jgi:hypothetical protein
MAATSITQETHHTSDHPIGWRRYVYSTNHKDIGMYLVFALVAGIIGGALSIGMRMELQQPGLQIFPSSHAYDVFTTAHGLIMIFFHGDAGPDRGLRQLDGAADDRGPRHGVPAHEQYFVLAAAGLGHTIVDVFVHGG